MTGHHVKSPEDESGPDRFVAPHEHGKGFRGVLDCLGAGSLGELPEHFEPLRDVLAKYQRAAVEGGGSAESDRPTIIFENCTIKGAVGELVIVEDDRFRSEPDTLIMHDCIFLPLGSCIPSVADVPVESICRDRGLS